MKKNGFCRAAMAGTALFLSIAVFPSQAAETGPGFEEAVEDTYDGPESPWRPPGLRTKPWKPNQRKRPEAPGSQQKTPAGWQTAPRKLPLQR